MLKKSGSVRIASKQCVGRSALSYWYFMGWSSSWTPASVFQEGSLE